MGRESENELISLGDTETVLDHTIEDRLDDSDTFSPELLAAFADIPELDNLLDASESTPPPQTLHPPTYALGPEQITELPLSNPPIVHQDSLVIVTQTVDIPHLLDNYYLELLGPLEDLFTLVQEDKIPTLQALDILHAKYQHPIIIDPLTGQELIIQNEPIAPAIFEELRSELIKIGARKNATTKPHTAPKGIEAFFTPDIYPHIPLAIFIEIACEPNSPLPIDTLIEALETDDLNHFTPEEKRKAIMELNAVKEITGKTDYFNSKNPERLKNTITRHDHKTSVNTLKSGDFDSFGYLSSINEVCRFFKELENLYQEFENNQDSAVAYFQKALIISQEIFNHPLRHVNDSITCRLWDEANIIIGKIGKVAEPELTRTSNSGEYVSDPTKRPPSTQSSYQGQAVVIEEELSLWGAGKKAITFVKEAIKKGTNAVGKRLSGITPPVKKKK